MSAATAEQFHVVLIPESGDPEIRRLEQLAQVANLLRTTLPTTKAFVFHGDRLDITTAPWRYLVWSQSPPIPLFEPPKVGKPDRSGNVGPKETAEDELDKTYAKMTEVMMEEDEARTAAQEAGISEEEQGDDDFDIDEEADEESEEEIEGNLFDEDEQSDEDSIPE